MNVMIITERPDDVLTNLKPVFHLYSHRDPNRNLAGQRFISVGFEGDTESAVTPLFDLDYHRDPNRHLLLVADNIGHLWQGMRELLDMVIETRGEEVEEWLVNLLHGSLS